jgi:hypothetical protein
VAARIKWGKQVKLELLYRASRDGWQGQDFHSRCDNKGATVTVIECTGGFVFGGYADVSWKLGTGGETATLILRRRFFFRCTAQAVWAP